MRYHITHLLLGTFTSLALSSCSSTEVIPSGHEKDSTNVTLSVRAPKSYGFGKATRADESFQLRLCAWLYPLSEIGEAAASSPIATYETIFSSNSTSTTLNFEIDSPGDYCVIAFADYIPENSSFSDGHYSDMYYDTTVAGKVTVKSDATNFFNNENRECFIGKIAFKKGLNSLEKDIALTRPISRIQLSAPSDPVEQLVSTIDITECAHLESYNFIIDNTEAVGTPSATSTDALALSGQYRVTPVENNLFYFYTFAGQYGDNNRPFLGDIVFSLNPKTDITLENTTRAVASGQIQPAVNYKIVVNGNKGWINAAPGGNDITVNIDVDYGWGPTEDI